MRTQVKYFSEVFAHVTTMTARKCLLSEEIQRLTICMHVITRTLCLPYSANFEDILGCSALIVRQLVLYLGVTIHS